MRRYRIGTGGSALALALLTIVAGSHTSALSDEVAAERVTETTAAVPREPTPYPIGSNPSGFVRVGDDVYFAAATLQHGRELWVTDGTENGTRMVT